MCARVGDEASSLSGNRCVCAHAYTAVHFYMSVYIFSSVFKLENSLQLLLLLNVICFKVAATAAVPNLFFFFFFFGLQSPF